MAENKCKYYKLVRQVSYNSGQTWSNVDPPQYQQGDLYEAYSSDCEIPQCDPIYRWNNNLFCIDGDQYTMQNYQVSNDCGDSWENVESADTRIRLYKFMVCDCGWESPYPISSGYTYDEECPQCYRTYWEIRCNEAGKYRFSIEQVSTDNGETWTNGSTGDTSLDFGDCECNTFVTIQPMADDDKIYVDTLPSRSIPESNKCNNLNYFTKDEFIGHYMTESNTKYVAIGNCVEKIENSAFSKWKKIEKLVLPNSIKYIGTYQMSESNKYSFKTLVVLSDIPPILGGNSYYNASSSLFPTYYAPAHSAFDWDGFVIDKIFVPSGSVDTYKSEGRWSLNIPPTSEKKPYLWCFIPVAVEWSQTDKQGHVHTGTDWTYSEAIMLNNKGVGISSIIDYFLLNSGNTPSINDEGWTTDATSLFPATPDKKIWNYKVITYTDATTITINPMLVVSSYGRDTTNLIGVASYYIASPHETGVSTSDSSWSIYADKIVGY